MTFRPEENREPTVPLDKKEPIPGSFIGMNQQWMSPVVRWTAQPVFRPSPVSTPKTDQGARSVGDRARRALNLVVASATLTLVSPFLIAIALAVKLSSPGPILYVQERVGLNRRRRTGDRRQRNRDGSSRRKACSGGKVFRMYKFRTMYVQKDGDPQVWAQKDDPRITPVGRVLRAFRLDELPQLWNVVRGEMNIVGPRPEQPEIFLDLRSEILDYSRRQEVLPGITGWAQVNNGYDQTFQDVARKLGYDLEYLGKRSTVEDFKIMMKTVPVVLGRKGYH